MKTLIRAFAIASAITGTFCAGAFAQPCAGPAVAPQALPDFIVGDAAVEAAQLVLPSSATSAYQFSDMNPLLVVNTATVDGNNLSLTKSTANNLPSLGTYVTAVDWTSTSPVYAVIVTWVDNFDVDRDTDLYETEVYYYNGATSDCNLPTGIISNIGQRAPMYHVTFVFGPEPVVDGCYQNETAWAAGTRYVSKGNWATYVSYTWGTTKTVQLLAGQTIDVGSAVIAPHPTDSNKVVISIILENALFQNGGSQIKIQDYASTPPSKNPAPGQFAHKATVPAGVTNYVMTVPKNNFYGIHLDVQALVPCD